MTANLRLVPQQPITRADVIRTDIPAFAVGLAIAAVGVAFAASLVLGAVAAGVFAALAIGRRWTA